MAERKYSLSELDRMRVALNVVHPWAPRSYPIGGRDPRDVEIEDRLRTCLIAGIDPEELEDAAREYVANLPAPGSIIPMVR